MKAQQTLADGTYDPKDYRTVYALHMLAHGDKSRADRARDLAAERYADEQIRKAAR